MQDATRGCDGAVSGTPSIVHPAGMFRLGSWPPGARAFCFVVDGQNETLVAGGEAGLAAFDLAVPTRDRVAGSPHATAGTVEKLLLVPRSNRLFSFTEAGTVAEWKHLPGTHAWEKSKEIGRAHGKAIFATAVDEDAGLLFTGGLDSSIKAWDIDTLAPRHHATVRGHDRGHPRGNGVLSFGWEGDGNRRGHGRLVAGHVNGTIREYAWDGTELESGEPVVAHDGPVFSIALHPGGMLLTAGADGYVRAWNGLQDGPVLDIDCGQGKVLDIETAGTGRHRQDACVSFFTAGGDGSIKAWTCNAGTRECKEDATLKGHGRTVEQVHFDPVKNELFSIASDATVGLWRL